MHEQNIIRWQAALCRDYGIDGVLQPLDGEFDLNFAVICDGKMAFVLKIMRPDCDPQLVEMQIDALHQIAKNAPDLAVPRVIDTIDGASFVRWDDDAGSIAWVISALPGATLGTVGAYDPALIHQIGRNLGTLTNALKGFDHPHLTRDFKWHPLQPHWIEDHLDVIVDGELKSQITNIIQNFKENIEPKISTKDHTAIHCDANDYNLLVTRSIEAWALSGIIDFGDMTSAPAICDLATAAAYLVLGQERPLEVLSRFVAGYHETHPLKPDDLELIFSLMLTRLAVSVVNSAMMKKIRPDDDYMVISEAPALAFLAMARDISPVIVLGRLRLAIGLEIVLNANRVGDWLVQNKSEFAPLFGPEIQPSLGDAPRCSCAIGDSVMPVNPTAISMDEAVRLVPEAIGNRIPHVGHYLEPRLVYTEPAFFLGAHALDGRRTMHLGIDVFMPAGASLFAPYEGIIVAAINRPQRLDYGGVVIMAHETSDGDAFYSLYGHLDPASIADLETGQHIAKGETFAALGDVAVNGGWQPHVHFQISVSLTHFGDARDHDWPGVGDADDVDYAAALYPNPAAMLGLDPEDMLYPIDDIDDGIAARKRSFGANLKLSYTKPLQLVRGWQHYLYDERGRTHLDAYNNVPHVGHSHPRLHAIAERQLRLINTNTRYLHPAQMAFAEALQSRLPDHLTHCYFVTSGSEANELALRLARAHTGGKSMVVQDHGYHGHTTGTIDLSPYKFNGPGGDGCPDWVEIVQVADRYRGPFGYDDANAGVKYAADVDKALDRIAQKGGTLAGFIAESFPSVGGQIEPPQDYLSSVYERIRAANGLCIADEVQTGLGRLGDAYWGFETQNAMPDIVVLGKPIGNGHPIGVVVTTAEIAKSFANGMEFFSTFGGTTLACLIGAEVLQIVDDEGLQANAAERGRQLLDGFSLLKDKYDIIGDVRGRGLFLGIELVKDQNDKTPARELAGFVANRLREYRILIGTDGPFDNVLKIRPPLTIGAQDCDFLLRKLDQVFAETILLNY
ncbi:aminotransferase class III-fold pyridoxal phosphate-dependent enzyme [Alphaproteobacteria bacterium]|nr:aminotransferase class III-fold pyridoxal phosphate-dependent enzyme [Alphaproteobacteria bacterium]